MKIIQYQDKYKQQIIDLILHIENDENKINLSLEEQPDLLDIPNCYEKNGGAFYIAVENNEIIGTFAFMNYGNKNAVLKKFFVRKDFRNKKLGLALYNTVLEKLKQDGYKQALLDTPTVALASHRFYEKAGFKKLEENLPPFEYEYPHKDSYLYLLTL